MSRLGLLTDPEGSGVYVGLSRRRHRVQSRQGRRADRENVSARRRASLGDRARDRLLRAMPDWRTLLQRIAERMPARARDDRAISRRQAADARPGADREGRDLGREGARPDPAREVFLQAQDRDRARADARSARHAVGLFLRDRQLPPALAHRADAALDEGARRAGKADPRQHGEVHARHQLGAQSGSAGDA